MTEAADLFESLPDPAILHAADGARLRINAVFEKAFPHAAASARPPWGRVQPPAFTENERCFEAAAPDGRRYEWRERLLADGARLAIGRDVSARADAADQAARARTTLFATLTHELRTPLNGVLGMAEILSQTMRSPSEREFLQSI
ncbi:MAG: histidine kinase dimerization/phospho-acceptor domain-containing protein, partial [Pseudomonadota bacterium]